MAIFIDYGSATLECRPCVAGVIVATVAGVIVATVAGVIVATVASVIVATVASVIVATVARRGRRGRGRSG